MTKVGIYLEVTKTNLEEHSPGKVVVKFKFGNTSKVLNPVGSPQIRVQSNS